MAASQRRLPAHRRTLSRARPARRPGTDVADRIQHHDGDVVAVDMEFDREAALGVDDERGHRLAARPALMVLAGTLQVGVRQLRPPPLASLWSVRCAGFFSAWTPAGRRV